MSQPIAGARRVMALDIRPRRAGFAVFESATFLLDAGTVSFTSRQHAVDRVRFLFKSYEPGVLVLRRLQLNTRRDNPETKRIFGVTRRIADERAIPIVYVTDKQLKEHFRSDNAHTKHQIASFLAQTFQELETRVPPARRLWQSERHRMSLFDAVAVGTVFLKSQGFSKRVEQGF